MRGRDVSSGKEDAPSDADAEQAVELAFSFDADGCWYHTGYVHTAYNKRNIITQNHKLVANIKESIRAAIEEIRTKQSGVKVNVKIFCGSARQSAYWDAANSIQKHGGDYERGSFLKTLVEITDELKQQLEAEFDNTHILLDKALTADIFNPMEEDDPCAFDQAIIGRTEQHQQTKTYFYKDIKKAKQGGGFEYALSPTKKQNRTVYDHEKILILYSQIHKLANEADPKAHSFYFYDDAPEILNALRVFFSIHPNLLPKDFKLHLKQYQGDDVIDFATITGTGEIDKDYKNTTKTLATFGTPYKNAEDLRYEDKHKDVKLNTTITISVYNGLKYNNILQIFANRNTRAPGNLRTYINQKKATLKSNAETIIDSETHEGSPKAHLKVHAKAIILKIWQTFTSEIPDKNINHSEFAELIYHTQKFILDPNQKHTIEYIQLIDRFSEHEFSKDIAKAIISNAETKIRTSADGNVLKHNLGQQALKVLEHAQTAQENGDITLQKQAETAHSTHQLVIAPSRQNIASYTTITPSYKGKLKALGGAMLILTGLALATFAIMTAVASFGLSTPLALLKIKIAATIAMKGITLTAAALAPTVVVPLSTIPVKKTAKHPQNRLKWGMWKTGNKAGNYLSAAPARNPLQFPGH